MSVSGFFDFFLFLIFLNNKFATCQTVIVTRGSDRVMWQWQWHMSLICQVSFSLSQFSPFILIFVSI